MIDAQRLIDAIASEPDELGHWLVYADWLLERGDPRGELMTIQLAEEAGRVDEEMRSRLAKLLRDEDSLLSPALAAHSHLWQFKFRRGFIAAAWESHASDEAVTPEGLAALFADPHAALLEDLSVTTQIDGLLDAPHPTLRCLHAHDLGSTAERLSESVPSLERLWLSGTRATLRLVHLNLRTLQAAPACCPALADEFALPRLETLSWELASTDDPVLRSPRSILARPPPTLQTLRISFAEALREAFAWNRPPDAPAVPRIVPQLATCAVAAQVRSLAIVPASVGDVEDMCTHASRFSQLESLRLLAFGFNFEQPSPAEFGPLLQALEQAFPGAKVSVGQPDAA